jgi:hypothetical protein
MGLFDEKNQRSKISWHGPFKTWIWIRTEISRFERIRKRIRISNTAEYQCYVKMLAAGKIRGWFFIYPKRAQKVPIKLLTGTRENETKGFYGPDANISCLFVQFFIYKKLSIPGPVNVVVEIVRVHPQVCSIVINCHVTGTVRFHVRLQITNYYLRSAFLATFNTKL